jgi:hypothetical protein
VVDQIPLRDRARQAPVLAARGDRVVEPRTPVPVRAWIVDGRGRGTMIRGHAVAWTSRLVRIVYFDDNGREGSAWWWASAVHREAEAPPARPAVTG